MSPASSSEISNLVKEFLDYLQVERGVSRLTVRNYSHYLRRLLHWMRKRGLGSLSDVNQGNIRQYRLHLAKLVNRQGLSLSVKTQGYHVIALRSFLRFLAKTDRNALAPDKLELPKGAASPIKFLTGEQVDRLLNSPTLSTIIGKRDKAILEVLFSTGLRVSELVYLDRDKLDLERREFGVIGKGGRSRVVFLSGRAAEWLKQYLGARSDAYKPVFIRHRGSFNPSLSNDDVRLTPRSVQRMVKKYVRRAKIPVDASPHSIRHSFATDLLMAGADLRSVQEMLGHKNVSTTQIYTHITNKQLKEVHQAFHGRSGRS